MTNEIHQLVEIKPETWKRLEDMFRAVSEHEDDCKECTHDTPTSVNGMADFMIVHALTCHRPGTHDVGHDLTLTHIAGIMQTIHNIAKIATDDPVDIGMFYGLSLASWRPGVARRILRMSSGRTSPEEEAQSSTRSMTSWNATVSRRANDFYRTPDSAIDPFLERIKVVGNHGRLTILEPSAGDGAIIDALKRRWPSYVDITASDVEPQRDDIERLPFVMYGYGMRTFDLIITNPPFSAAEQFVRQGLAMLMPKTGRLALLLRLGFIASQSRSDLFAHHMPLAVYVLSQRPSFTGQINGVGDTDASEYAWFVWRREPFEGPSKLERL